uniref:Uncharacterized protein n=1 Tax=Panagrolaimus sp. PS1159 TaxID=55785 RepID=A0AC35GH73_9BILA
MEFSVFDNASLTKHSLHIEILENIDDLWPEGMTFPYFFKYQMPVTQKLIKHLEEFNTEPIPSWMYLAYPEAKKLLERRDPGMILKMDLSKIMKLENQINPYTVPYSFNIWLKEIEDAKLEFESIEVLKKDEISYTVPGEYFKPTVTFIMSKNTLKTFCHRYTEHVEPLREIFEYISSLCLPGARVILIDDDCRSISINEILQLQIERKKFITIFCKFLPLQNMDEFYVEVKINIEKMYEYPVKIHVLPEGVGLEPQEKLWDNDEPNLEQNLYNCILGKEPLDE